jgi:hypothetical protein
MFSGEPIMTKALSALLLLLGLMASNSNASTICKIEDSLTGIKAIAWNDEDGTAKITDMLNNTLAGRISLKRKHDGGEKVNIYLKYERPYYGDDAAEYIIFPVGNGHFRVIGVTYVIRNNEKYLNTSSGNFLATCIKL